MTTATKAKPADPKPTSAFAASIGKLPATLRDYLETLWELQEDEPTPWEVEKQGGQLGLDPQDVQILRGVVADARSTVAVGRPRKQRIEDEFNLARVNKLVAEKLADIEARQAALDAERNEEEGRLADARAIVEGNKVMVDKLQRINPRIVQQIYQQQLTWVVRNTQQRISEIRTTLEVIERLKKISHVDQQAILHCEAAGVNIVRTKPNNGIPFIEAHDWDSYVNRRQMERPQLEAELRNLECERKNLEAEVSSVLDFFVDKLG
jgi:phage terminase Nu1 subunit (DNA packaging protein)